MMTHITPPADPRRRLKLSNPCHLLAVGFGSGLSRWLPGTAGTLAALPFWYGLSYLPFPLYWLTLALAALLGVYLCGRTAKDMGVHDHGAIVWDEFVGLWITLGMLTEHHWQNILAGFVVFRLLDMIKPWPISWLDRHIGGGVGIMLDDILAGIIAGILLYFALLYF